jgi:lipid-binding SYLF domain-containing protein
MTTSPRFYATLRTRMAASLMVALALTGIARADTAREINASTDAAVADFRRTIKGADDYLAAAKGVLVVPHVKKVGLIAGGQWGEGALRVKGKTVAYYKMTAASVGFQAGYQEANYLFIFLTDESLKKFRTGKGWDAGIDAGVTVVDQSVGASVDTLKAKSSVVAFIFGKEGLMGGYSLKGQKLSRFEPKK